LQNHGQVIEKAGEPPAIHAKLEGFAITSVSVYLCLLVSDHCNNG